MTAFAITVTNSMSVLGGGPASNWGTMIWLTDYWGEGSTDYIQSVGKLIAAGTITVDDSNLFNSSKVFTNSLDVTGDMYSEGLGDGRGYSYLFQDRTTEGESRSTNSWTSATAGTAAWATATVCSTSWA